MSSRLPTETTCPFFKLYDVLPNSAEMYLALDYYSLAGFKELQVQVKKQLLSKNIKLAKYRLNINQKEVAMVAVIMRDGTLIFIIKTKPKHCRVVITKTLLSRVETTDLGSLVLTETLQWLHSLVSGNLSDQAANLEYSPICFLIDKCAELGEPITNPLD